MDTGSIVFLVVTYWCAFALAGAYCSKVRGRPGPEGFIFGLLFGPLGVLIAAVLSGGPSPIGAWHADLMSVDRAAREREREPKVDFSAIPAGGKGAVEPLAPARPSSKPASAAPPPVPKKAPRKLLGEVSEPWMGDIDS